MTTQNFAPNPLLDLTDLPRWADITPSHVNEAISTVLKTAQASLISTENIAPEDATWDSVMTPLSEATEALSRVWGVVSHCHHVVDTPEWREAYNAHLEAMTEFSTTMGQSEKLLAHYQTFAAAPMFDTLSPIRQHIVTTALRDFKLSGALLNDADKLEFAQLRAREAALQAKFSENVLDATNSFAYFATADEVIGVPAEALSAMGAAAAKDEKEGLFKITLQFPSYFPVIQYAERRDLREKLYRAYVTRASEFGDSALDNSPLMVELLTVRQRMAALLGFAHYSDVSLASKMAESVPQVTSFLYNLATKAQPSAKADFAQLTEFAATLGLSDLEAWDVTYVSEKLRENRYAFSEQEVKDYFPLPIVLNGLFHVIEQLFGIRLVQKTVQTWHADVRFFELLNAQDDIIGGVYLDPYAREGKNAGAWMDEVRARRVVNGHLQTPVAHMVTNFTPPQDGKDATLTHDDIITLFHETGHALHHLLTEMIEPEVSGIRGVEWDAVELPSQFMENFCWDFEILSRMSAHIKTSDDLPRELFNKILAAKNFQSGLQMLRQVEFSLYDIMLHERFSSDTPQLVNGLIDQLRNDIAVVKPPAFNRFQHSFSHIFAGGYSAGYFSYKWAEVLSADVFSKFEDAQADSAPLLNPALGEQYRAAILAVGGSRPAMTSFKQFMEREPNVDALLRHSGLAVEA